MGFLTDLAKTAISLIAPATSPILGSPVSAALGLVGGATGLPIGGSAAATRVGATVVGAVAPTGGNGTTHTRTVIQSISNATGEVIREEIRMGSPFLMNRDFQIANRVFSSIAKAGQKLPRKVVKQSAITMLKNQVVEGALRNAADGHHHHNGNGNGNG